VLQRIGGLFRNLAIYGLGDAATSVVSFLLLPVYVRYLSAEDYGVIGLLLTVEAVSKILFRWGVDASFMRLYYDCPDRVSRQRLASTIFWFLAAVNGTLLLAALAATPALSRHLFSTDRYATVLALTLVNTFVVGFYFLPFHVLRIKGQSPRFIALSFSRSAGTLVLRLALVVGLKLGVLGVVLADVVVTAIFTALLGRWFAQVIRPTVSLGVLREVLSFGLPRVPHGVAHQVTAVADRYILTLFVSLREIGLYSVGASFGLGMKLFLSAFEYAWAPFYFETMKEPDAKRTFSLVATYGLAALALLAAGLAAVSTDLVRLMTTPAFYEAARVIPWIGLGVLFQGVYLLTSIGLNITKQTRYYPVATVAAAMTSVTANLLLVPRFGAVGAAWANTLAYVVLAIGGFLLSRRFYPIAYEWGRVGRAALAGVSAYTAALVLVPTGVPVPARLLLHGGIVVLAFPLVLWATGFYRREELAVVARLVRRFRRRSPPAAVEESPEMAGDLVAALPDETVDAPPPEVDAPASEADAPARGEQPGPSGREGAGTRDRV
jgi:O-antigen/teichoic acid export membrane protein